ncbi:hypothetical protein [Alistipes sp.]|uniref:hypothetical protein n=1 Tax=Alistipes sp. TaxID=1872444 RepID=UPI003AEF87C6
MKAVNFWKTLFCAALAVTAFTACSDDDDNGYSGMPEITVNGGESVTLAGKLEGGKIDQTVEVVSKGDWTLKFDNAGDSQWVTPSTMSGKTGTTQLTFTLGQASAERTANLTLTASSTFEGIPITKTATIKIVQSNSDVPTGNALYSENCGTKVEKDGSYWPYVDKFEGWTRGGSLDQKAVTYGGSDASVRNSGALYEPTESEKSEVSGAPYVYIGKTTAKFEIENINVGTNNNFTFTFTALDQEKYSGTPVFAEINASTIKFAVSVDGGTTYSPVAFTAKKIATGGWYLCTAEFKFPASVSTDKISVRFSDYPFTGSNVDGHQGLRLDDFKLYEGGNGPELGEGSTEEYKKVTIDQITSAGNFEVEGATIVGVHQKGVLFAQNNNGTVNYILGFNNDWATQTANPYIGDIDKTATVKGTSELRIDLYQFSSFEVTVGAASSLQLPAPATFDAAALSAYIASPAVYKYAKISGTLNIEQGTSYNTYTIDVTGFSDKKIQIAYGLDSYFNGYTDGDVVDVLGFALGYDNSKINIMLRSISKNTTTPAVEITTTPQQFAATSPEVQTLSYTVANTTADQVTFALEGTNADKFALGTKTDNSIQVSAKGNNTTDAAYTANLVAKVAGVTLASVELKQAASNAKNYVPVTVAPADWSGDYVVGYPDGEVCYILKDKYSGATATRSTFTYEKLQSPAFDKTNIVYDASYKTITIAKIVGTDFYSIKYGDMYVGWTTSTKNSCEFSTAAPSASTPDYQWTPTIVDGLIVLTCTTHEAGKAPRTLQFNANSGQERFAIYASTQKSVMLYKLQ